MGNAVRPFPNGDQIFEVCAIYHQLQTKEQRDKGEHQKSKIIVDVKRVFVKDDKAANMLVIREIPEEYADKLDQVEIIVRPF